MALTVGVSPIQLAPMMAADEVSYGVRPTFNPATMAFLTYTSPNPFKPTFNSVQLLPHQLSWTKQRDIPTTRMMPVNLTFGVQGGGTATTEPTYAPLMHCSAMVKGAAGTAVGTLIAKAVTAQPVGTSAILATTGTSCALKTGDIITFAGDTQKYVVTSPAVQPGAAAAVTININPAKQAPALVGSEAITIVPNINYTPATISTIASATLAMQYSGEVGSTHSMVQECNGLYGSLRFTGSADKGLMAAFSGMGLYQRVQMNTDLKTLYGGGTNAWTPPQNNANTFILSDGARVVIDDGVLPYFGVLSSFVLDLGVVVTPIPDVNSGATFGLYSLAITDRNPTCTITFAMDTNEAAGVKYSDFQADCDAATPHRIYFNYPDLGGRILHFSIPFGQVTNQVPGEDSAFRNNTVTYKVQSATPETEFTISQT